MSSLILSLIFIGSLAGIFVLVLFKIPVLRKIKPGDRKKVLSNQGKRGIKELVSFLRLEKVFRPGFWNIIPEKILSRIKILASQTERKSSVWLVKIRERAKEKQESKLYWQKLSNLSLRSSKKKRTGKKKKKVPL